MKQPIFVPDDIFGQMLEWMAIPTFDLVIRYGQQGVVIVKRKISPYKNIWALPGLRMMKGEDIEDVLRRIAKKELGIDIDPSQRQFLSQYVGKFSTDHHRQDISTGYLIEASNTQALMINKEHFSNYQLISSPDQIPDDTGAMYRYYLEKFFSIDQK